MYAFRVLNVLHNSLGILYFSHINKKVVRVQLGVALGLLFQNLY
jgi:hypothetical protein